MCFIEVAIINKTCDCHYGSRAPDFDNSIEETQNLPLSLLYLDSNRRSILTTSNFFKKTIMGFWNSLAFNQMKLFLGIVFVVFLQVIGE